MFEILTISLSGLLFFALHVINNKAFKKPLSGEEEKVCIEQMEKGDVKSKDKLIEHNLRLVAHIVKKYYNKQSEQDDLISIGTIGLIKAVNSFKSDKNIKFSTYASKCIENEILMYFRSQKKNSNNLYINDSIDVDKNGNPLTLLDIIPDTTDVEQDIENKINIEKMLKVIEYKLSSREKLIIKMRYGLDGFKPLTQREVSLKLNISRSYVSRIEKKSLSTIEKYINENKV
ncbi:MAG: RNA polymerase sporulation sigma factor SigK [Oscillospiraceae bacterium]